LSNESPPAAARVSGTEALFRAQGFSAPKDFFALKDLPSPNDFLGANGLPSPKGFFGPAATGPGGLRSQRIRWRRRSRTGLRKPVRGASTCNERCGRAGLSPKSRPGAAGRSSPSRRGGRSGQCRTYHRSRGAAFGRSSPSRRGNEREAATAIAEAAARAGGGAAPKAGACLRHRSEACAVQILPNLPRKNADARGTIRAPSSQGRVNRGRRTGASRTLVITARERTTLRSAALIASRDDARVETALKANL
jgi:hypothetical protein